MGAFLLFRALHRALFMPEAKRPAEREAVEAYLDLIKPMAEVVAAEYGCRVTMEPPSIEILPEESQSDVRLFFEREGWQRELHIRIVNGRWGHRVAFEPFRIDGQERAYLFELFGDLDFAVKTEELAAFHVQNAGAVFALALAGGDLKSGLAEAPLPHKSVANGPGLR